MRNRKLRLVLECVVLATELVRFATELVAFLNMAFNYPFDEREVGFKVPD